MFNYYCIYLQGFEPRGTEISNRLTAYKNLVNDPDLTPSPQIQEAVIQLANKLYLNTAYQKNNTTSPVYRFKRAKRKSVKPFFCDVPGLYKIIYSLSHPKWKGIN
jgi:hypothetical protein